VKLNPILEEARDYPFAKLVEIRRQREAAGRRVLDFSMGDPREPTPPFLREAMKAAVPEVSSYPTARGSIALRRAAAGYVQRRFGVTLDPDAHLLPVNGTKEGIFTSHLALIDPKAHRRTVVTFSPEYPVYAEGARYAGGVHHPIVLEAAHRFRPDLRRLDRELLERTAVMWVNYPHNPTGAEIDAELLARLRALAREHDFVLCSDECYADLCFEKPSPSALVAADAPDFRNLLVFHSCSKRSSMTGYRSGFVAGDPRLIAALARFRPAVGVATPEFVQAMATAAWSDDAHVKGVVETYRRRRDVFLELFRRKGWSHDGGAATFYLWWRVPESFRGGAAGATTTATAGAARPKTRAELFAERLLELDVLVTPGSWLGLGGEQHVRLALVASEADCLEAVARLEGATL
jgi:acetylornithine aminotransferase